MQEGAQYDHGGLYEDPSEGDRRGSGQDRMISQQRESNDKSERSSRREEERDEDVMPVKTLERRGGGYRRREGC